MILVDSSAWVEYLRATGSPVHVEVRTYHDVSDELAISEVVALELFAGVRTAREERAVEAIVAGVHLLAADGLDDHLAAAALYRQCRQRGATIRHLNNCLLAAIAIRNDVPILHRGADFDALARYTPLRVV